MNGIKDLEKELFVESEDVLGSDYVELNIAQEYLYRAYIKAVDDVFDSLKEKRSNMSMIIPFDDLEIKKYKEEILKGGEVNE